MGMQPGMVPPIGGFQPPIGGPPPYDPSMMMGVDPSMGFDPLMGLGGMLMPPPPPMLPEQGPMEMLEPIPDEVEEFVPPGPQSLPAWFRPEPEPKVAEILEEADRERMDHELRIRIAMEMVARLNNERTGIFEKDREAIENGEKQKGRLTDLIDEHNAYCAHHASMDYHVKVPLKDAIDREEGVMFTDAGHYLLECFERQHAAAGNASLRWAFPDMVGKYGMLAAMVVLDPSNEECGLRFQMLDPATVFPVYEGGMGLARVIRVYQAEASAVMGTFYDAAGTVQKKVRKAATFSRRYDPHHTGEVIEWWDKTWVKVLFDGKEIFKYKHGYGKVPIRIKYAGFGQQAFTQTARIAMDDYGVPTYYARSTGSDVRREDLARIAQPFLWRRVEAHDIEEAVMGLFLDVMRQQANPKWIAQLGMQSHNDGAPTPPKAEGEVGVFRDDDIMTPQPPVLTPDVVNAITGLTAQNKQTGMASGVIMGQMPGSQTTGNAADITTQAGLEKWRPIGGIIEEFLTELLEWSFELWRDWGGILGMEDNYGVLYVPRRNPNPRTGKAPAHELTPKIIRTYGIRCKVELRKFNPSNLSNLVNGLAIAANLGVLDKRTMIELMGITNNPDLILERIEDETFNQVPEVLQEKTLRRYVENARKAEERGDLKSAEEYMNAAYFIASTIERKQMIGQAMDPMTGLMAGTPVPNQVQTMTDPALTGLPGAQGGRPSGSGGGQQARPAGPLVAG